MWRVIQEAEEATLEIKSVSRNAASEKLRYYLTF